MSSNDILKTLEDKSKAAFEIAASLGEIVGFVSRTSPSLINEEGGYVVFDVDPVVYFSNFQALAQAGSHLGVVDIKTLCLVSLKVISVERRDILAELDLPDMYTPLPYNEVSGLLTKTRIKAKPLLAFNIKTGEVTAANYVIEPQSPVVILRDTRAIQSVLGLPSEGVFLGYVTVGDTPIFEGNAQLFLPLKAFYQHVLVVGTTGSGKTTLLKNMIASIIARYKLGDPRVSLIVIDPNKDYVTMTLKPLWKVSGFTRDDEYVISEKIAISIPGLSGLIVLLPITRTVVEEYVEKAENWARVLKMLAEDYIKSILSPITRKFNWSYTISELEVVEEPVGDSTLRFVKAAVEVNYGCCKDLVHYYVVPYALRYTDFKPKELVALNPYFTRQAKDALLRLTYALKQKNAYIETIYDLYEALKEARFRIEEKSRPRGVVLDPNKEYVVEVIKDLAIHKSTLENMIRQIAAITDTGIFDVYVKGHGDKYLREPPIDYILEKHFEKFNGYPIVVDLEFLQLHSQADPEKTISIVAFRILNKVFEWKLVQSRFKFETQPILIFIDEAHRFFPSKSGVEEYLEHVSGMIDRIARLGRSRKLGLVFSTHSPKDVHDIILQLTNTKIVLRTDKTHLSTLDLPAEYRDFITRASDRVGVLKSHVLRLGYVTFRTPLPLTGHYDLSAIT
ncbi:MAG: ATP-binding protein [Desulfurococcaceae archaeon]